MASKYTAQNPKQIFWTGQWKPFNDYITEKHQPNGNIIRTIRLEGETTKQRIDTFFRKYADYVFIGMSMVFAERAAKYTPPNMGRANIEQKYYFRPVQDLTLLVKGAYPPYHATKADFAALREGYKFRVLNTKVGHKRNEVYAYTKGVNEAKRVSRIQLRGLSKYSWGSMMKNPNELIKKQIAGGAQPTDISVFKATKLPPIFQRLATKSPDITKYHWGNYDWNPNAENTNLITFTIENRLTDIQRYGIIAVKQGLNAAVKYCGAVFKSIQITSQNPGTLRTGNNTDPNVRAISDLRQSLVKMFDNVTVKYGIQKLDITKDSNQKGRMPQHIQNIINIKD